MIKNDAGEKVSAQTKAKIELTKYLDAFDLSVHCEDFNDMKRTEPDKVTIQIEKIKERLYKKLVIK